MASKDEAQDFVGCNLCQQPVSFFCRRCGVNLCDPCAIRHLRVKSKNGHNIVDYTSKDDDDTCHRDYHSHKCFVLLGCIISLIALFLHLQNNCSAMYQLFTDEVTAREEEYQKQIEEVVKKLHQKMDDMQKEHEVVLQKQKKEFEEMIEKVWDMQKAQNDVLQKQKKEFEEIIEKVNEINEKTIKIQKTKIVKEMQTFIPYTCIRKRKIMTEVLQYSIPKLYKRKIDELLENELTENEFSCRRILDIPTVTSVIDTGFPADEKYKSRLFDMAVTDDNKVWMGGASNELKLFDLQGHLHHTVSITNIGMYLCMHNKQVVYSDQSDNTMKMIFGTDNVVTMFTTGDWVPYGVTSTASGDLLVCLRKDDQSKVVRYSSTGTVLQEIQYDSQRQPLYKKAAYITENVNGDIIVTDWKKKAVIAVDRLGIFRYLYSGKDSEFFACSVATDSVGHVIVTGGVGKKISMLDRDGRFLRYIIPEGGIKDPRGVCILGDVEMMVGECLTGIAKRIKYLED
ncbi:uncharacterized protein LOC128175355 [Crassostrea angulata]|uniref:uncharacterized protein LOC128175355 n=1 Tax=Magallana angulata TaxID=2784310 RepID=UPI0022B15516|nr:uncharacterized protein LOC128175355 [Crassostrea angulata]XP_052696875.1 uncharacterized protein LOC128175355 [Crassostrea angulata]